MHLQYVRTGDDAWRRMTKFWGKLFLINFAIALPPASFRSSSSA